MNAPAELETIRNLLQILQFLRLTAFAHFTIVLATPEKQKEKKKQAYYAKKSDLCNNIFRLSRQIMTPTK